MKEWGEHSSAVTAVIISEFSCHLEYFGISGRHNINFELRVKLISDINAFQCGTNIHKIIL